MAGSASAPLVECPLVVVCPPHPTPPPTPNTCSISFISYQGKISRDTAPLPRRNSYTPLCSRDQMKRPRLYSAGNAPWLPLAPTPSALLPDGRQSQVSERVSGSHFKLAPVQL